MKKLRIVKLKNTKNRIFNRSCLLRTLFISLAILISGVIKAQDIRINIKLQNVSLGEILQEIKVQSKKNILYNNKKVDIYKNESINLENATVEEALKESLKGKNLKYKIVDDVIIIEPTEEDNNVKPKNLTGEQVLRGQVIDLNTETPLIGANVILSGSSPVKGAITNIDGNFEIKGVPVGRQSIEVSYVGYNNAVLNNIYIYAGKEAVITIKLEEKVQTMEDVVVKSVSRKDQPLNEMAQVSARSFTVEETERYAGGFGDPSRMAASYAGILTLGSQINDIIIRGNSTNGMLWRMEGLRIPNPNHFGSLSSSGGATSMLNNNVLANSDFYTGAFPAEFGDATSGIFDLKLKKGNNETTEKMMQVGVGGIEAGVEGPLFKKGNGSYIANYRYSTMGVFKLTGFDIGISVIPAYQDLSFNINLPLKNGSKLSVFGLGGIDAMNGNEFFPKENKHDITILDNKVGFTGMNYLQFINDKSSISTSIGLSSASNRETIDNRRFEQYSEFHWAKYNESSFEITSEYKNKINSKNYLKIGVDLVNTSISFADSFYLEKYKLFFRKENGKGGEIPLFQSYAEWKYRINENLSAVGGIHYQYSQIGNDHSIEPRFSIKWDFLPRQSLNLGIGRHSKLQPKFVYHHEALIDTINKIYDKPNQDLKMSRSDQVVLGYNYLFNSNHRLKIEGYYQYLSKIPVEKDSSYKSLINYGTSFSEYDYNTLVNKGTGFNYGTELTWEKFLSNGYYYLVTLSLFESKYRGSDGVLRNTRFNAKYIFNLVGGYEWFIKNRNTFGIDARMILAGGERKIPLNYTESARLGQEVIFANRAYDEKFKDYFRIDFKISYKINRKTSHTLALDILNVTNRINHFIATYDKDKNDYKEVSTLSMLPSVLWRWNF